MPDLSSFSLKELIAEVEGRLDKTTNELPLDVFLFCARHMTTVNIDIIVRNFAKDKVLLVWRDDNIFGQGWHIPGRIIRYEESTRKTLDDCMAIELNLRGDFTYTFLEIKENEDNTFEENTARDERGSHIALIYEVILKKEHEGSLQLNDSVQWFASEPDNVIDVHKKIISKLFDVA